LSRHRVMTLESSSPYHNRLPVVMDWTVPNGIYFRCYGGRQAMVGDTADAGLAASWTGIYDVTPDWNPVLGALPGIGGLHVAFGFSGHGFKLSPMIGRIVAQAALDLTPDLPLAPYSIERFARGNLLLGGYGASVVS